MLKLEDGMVLYHGSYTRVERPDLSRCRPGKDFGRGFYLTTSRDQAVSFAGLSARKNADLASPSDWEGRSGYLSVFRVSKIERATFIAFEDANREWLHFVAANRREPLFPETLRGYRAYDVVAGKIANDQTARTLQLYVTGAYGEPGSKQADDIAIATLLPNRLEDQFCFRTERALSMLDFLGSEVAHG